MSSCDLSTSSLKHAPQGSAMRCGPCAYMRVYAAALRSALDMVHSAHQVATIVVQQQACLYTEQLPLIVFCLTRPLPVFSFAALN